MRRIAALMPTRDRAVTASRAVEGFLTSIYAARVGLAARICVIDDSTIPRETLKLAASLRQLGKKYPETSIDVVPGPRGHYSLENPFGGPGAVRNRGLRYLRSIPHDHDDLVMFDDDIAFGPLNYRGSNFLCSGQEVLEQALAAARVEGTIAGCEYAGRQDLSILEHARTQALEMVPSCTLRPSLKRLGVENVAPGGISTAFLAIGTPAHSLPDFVEHYNEDYLWLHRMVNAGWKLNRVSKALIHAPPGDVGVGAETLSFQVFGEIVWLAVLERARYSQEDPAGMAAAIAEILGDLESAQVGELAVQQSTLRSAVSAVFARYASARQSLLHRRPDPIAILVAEAIRNASEYCYGRRFDRRSLPNST